MLQFPLVILFEQHGADQPYDRRLVRKDAKDVGAPLDLLVDALERVRIGYAGAGFRRARGEAGA